MLKKVLIHLGVLILIILSLSGLALAQGGVIGYGQTVQGTLTATAPLGFYTFTGTAEDAITIYAISITPGLNPGLSLLGTNAQQLAFSAGDPYTPISGDASISYRLPQNGAYTILVSSLDGTPGDYILSLQKSESVSTVLPQGQTAEAPVSGDTQVFLVDLDPNAPTTLSFTPDPPDTPFVVQVRDSNGQLIGVFDSALIGNSLNFPPGDGQYEVTLVFTEPESPGTVQVVSGAGAEPPTGAPTAPPPAATEEVSPPPVATEEVGAPTGPPAGVCSIQTEGTVNVRSGPGTNYDTIGQLQPGVYYVATGINNGWYVIDFNGLTGWVANFVVLSFGPCNNLPFAAASGAAPPAGPTATYTATSTTSAGQTGPTATSPAQVAPTATYTPSYTPTQAPVQATPTSTYTPSYTPTTPPGAQVAPPDARFNNPLNIPLDNTVSVLDFVSYPGGDTEDRVSYSVTGMNPNSSLSGGQARLIISASCFGQGTQNIQFFTGGQTYSCGQTLVDKTVTADSDTGSVVITAVGGDATYVQWVLTGTATRTN